MAKKETTIVIKKIYPPAAAGHGGSWKVAFADFMTAMMCFFLVMWLVNQSDTVKKNVSDYFSTPSIIEYNYNNYGAIITLEKLFLDLVNEPMKALQQFTTPVDKAASSIDTSDKKVLMEEIAERFTDTVEDISVDEDEIKFEIPDYLLFEPGTSKITARFSEVMENVRGMTGGLEDADVYIDSVVYEDQVPSHSRLEATRLADKRLDIVAKKVEKGLENETVDVFSKIETGPSPKKPGSKKEKSHGLIKFKIKPKKELAEGKKSQKVGSEKFGGKGENMSVYDNFVKQVVNRKKVDGATRKR